LEFSSLPLWPPLPLFFAKPLALIDQQQKQGILLLPLLVFAKLSALVDQQQKHGILLP
jgi:hypothetical protein